MKKKKILINKCYDTFIRNYISNNAFNSLEKNYDCYFIANSNTVYLKNIIKKKKNFLGFYKFQKNEIKKFSRYFTLNYFKQKNNGLGLKYNYKIVSSFRYKYYNEDSSRIILMFIPRFSVYLLKKFFYYFFSIFNLKYEYIDDRSISRKKLKKILLDTNPDLIISPIQGCHIGHNEINILAKDLNIKTVALIDNWDNLSSKPMLKPLYDYFMVWGKQSQDHARSIHNIAPKKIKLVGTSRFDHYYKDRSKKIKSHYNFKYILFLESWGVGYFSLHKYDEQALDILDEYISKNKKLFGDIKIIYRPYPWRMTKEIIDFSKYKNIELDKQLKKNYLNKKFDNSIQPSLSYYPSLIKNAQLVIAGPTSMVIETAIFNKKTIVTSQDSEKFLSNGNFIINSEHFDNIEKISQIKLCKNVKNIGKMVEKGLFNKSKKKSFRTTDNQINFFLYNDSLKYSERLNKKVTEILNNN